MGPDRDGIGGGVAHLPPLRATTHASFFSGVGGLDLGLERAGWRTVSFSEIDPYASAVLAERWPGVPNLGDITILAGSGTGANAQLREATRQQRHEPWADAGLWTGGFPCQDLSVAGKRRGLAGERSGLAFTFLDLVERHRPPAVLLENVPGLLSSHAGRDLGVLLGRLGQLRYGWAFRVLDAQWFGVPQRRRRVFILALDTERYPDEHSAGQVLAVGTRCGRDHQAEREARAGVAGGSGRSTHGSVADGATTTRTLGANMGHHGYALGAQDADGGYVQVAAALTSRQERHNHPADQSYIVDGPPSDPDRVRASDGLAGRLDGGQRLEATNLWHQPDRIYHTVAPTLGGSGMLPAVSADTGHAGAGGRPVVDPLGLDSRRYKAAGNGVVAPVAEWLGWRLRRYMEGTP